MPPHADAQPFRLTAALRRRHRVEDGWSFAMERRARWHEVDGFGHVNNVSYLIFFEDARNCYLESVGLPPLDRTTPGPVLARTAEEYLKPLAFADTFLVSARTRRLGRTSLAMEYAVWRDGLIARGEAVCVLMISATGAKVPVPDAVRAKIEALDGAVLEA